MSFDATVLAMMGGGFAACGTAIGVMWSSLKSENARLSARSDDCEKDRKILFHKIAELTGDSEMLERCPAPKCPLRSPTTRVILRPVAPVALMLCLLASCASTAPKDKPMTTAEITAMKAENAKFKALPKPGEPGRQDIFTHTDPAPATSTWTQITNGFGPLGTLVGAIGTSAANITTASLALVKYLPTP